MDPLALVLLGPRLTLRALDDLHAIAIGARDGVQLLASLDETAREVQEQITGLTALAERVEGRIDDLLRMGDTVLVEGEAIQGAAQDLSQRAAEIATALPLLERAVALAEPLEGSVERLGRIVDRLPGGRARAPRP